MYKWVQNLRLSHFVHVKLMSILNWSNKMPFAQYRKRKEQIRKKRILEFLKRVSRCSLTEEMSRANVSHLLLAIPYQVITKIIT